MSEAMLRRVGVTVGVVSGWLPAADDAARLGGPDASARPAPVLTVRSFDAFLALFKSFEFNCIVNLCSTLQSLACSCSSGSRPMLCLGACSAASGK